MLAAASLLGSAAATGAPQHVTEIMPGYNLSWALSGTHLTVEISAATGGWVSFGIASNGGMKGADMMVGWVDGSGQANVEDYWSEDFATPTRDESQDWELISGAQACEDACTTQIVAQRRLDTHDELMDWPIRTASIALSSRWVSPTISLTTVQRRGQRGRLILRALRPTTLSRASRATPM